MTATNPSIHRSTFGKLIRIPGWRSILIATLLLPVSASGQDMITVADPDSGVQNRFPGQVVGWDAERLTYVAGGRERQVVSSRVLRVDYPRSASHQEAERFFQSGRFDQAALALENASKQETRPWVVEEMRARRIQCALATGDIDLAIAGFLEIIRANPQTRFFHLIPLAWQTRQRAQGLLASDLQRLLNPDEPVLALIAASWLLMNDDQEAANVLRRLAIAGDSRVAQLATAQQWRPDVISADQDEWRRWHDAIDRMPESLQAGPRYVAAVVQQRLQGDGHAVVALLQVPVLFPEQYQLAGDALWQAHQLLKKLGRDEEADLVARELLQSYGYSAAAAGFQNPIDQMDQ